MTSDLHSLHDRARSTALTDAAQALRANSQAQPRRADAGGTDVGMPGAGSPDRVSAGDPPAQGDQRPGGPPRPGPQRQRRSRNRRNGDGAGGATEEALALLADATQELAAARREIDRLRGELDNVNGQLLEETQEAALIRRQRDGLQHRTDYLEEKLELLTRALGRANRPWWRRLSGS